MTLYLVNGFSQAMLRDPTIKEINTSLTEEEFINIIHNNKYKSVLGHQVYADYVTKITGINVPKNRQGITLTYEDTVILISLNGRLPEHVKDVEVEGRANFTFKRFEKQTTEDLLKSSKMIEEMLKIEEM